MGLEYLFLAQVLSLLILHFYLNTARPLQHKISLKMIGSFRLLRFTVLILLKGPLDKKNYNELAPGVSLLKLLHFEVYFNKEV